MPNVLNAKGNASVKDVLFGVEREPLFRRDGQAVGYDAIYRRDDRSQLSVVSEGYRLFTHREAIDFVGSMMGRADINTDNVDRVVWLDRNGARMFYELRFKDQRFNVAKDTGVRNTALDGEPKVDDIIPTITVRNSYDKTTALEFDGGGHRVWCANGMAVFESAARISIPHKGSINLEDHEQFMVEQIAAVVDGVKRSYSRMNTESGFEYLIPIFVEKLIANRYLKMVEESLKDYITVEWEIDNESEGKRKPMKPVQLVKKQDLSAWLAYCVLTEVATHRVSSIGVSRAIHGIARKTFME